MLKNLQYVVVHAVQVDDDLGMNMTYEIYIDLYTNAAMEEKT